MRHNPVSDSTEYVRLWSAVMIRALEDLKLVIKAHKDLTHPAVTTSEPWRWFHSDSLDRGSFRWICSHLGFDPEETRHLLRHNWRNLMRKKDHYCDEVPT